MGGLYDMIPISNPPPENFSVYKNIYPDKFQNILTFRELMSMSK